MFQVEHILGMPILRENGKQIGRIKDFWFDEFWKLTAMVLDQPSLLNWKGPKYRVIYMKDILQIGENVLLVQDDAVITMKRKKELLRTFHFGIVQLKNMPVMTHEGQYLGRVSDVYFQFRKGKPQKQTRMQFVGYELTDGFLADILEGRQNLPLPCPLDNVTLGEDAIIIPASYKRLLTREPLGKVVGEQK